MYLHYLAICYFICSLLSKLYYPVDGFDSEKSMFTLNVKLMSLLSQYFTFKRFVRCEKVYERPCDVCLSLSIAYIRSIDIIFYLTARIPFDKCYCLYHSSELDRLSILSVHITNAALTPWVETTNGLRYYWPPQRKSALAYRKWNKSI